MAKNYFIFIMEDEIKYTMELFMYTKLNLIICDNMMI